ncbi:Homocysteine S-methyltransferase [Cutaneotrichosporon oleaginosum]|uniref:Homocysteine S-methyltransferase n=1 Tax=Cutaneotrichosporon oleaginosum TaxID=879819 RepID=A0A0J1B850_9TREE|nr:Homocysteine S-methyltransferase [Cutaneotrichosporon oleaginosum]KLT43944.1 Homocysteine S-methyltransferase [Cutaneotrichosporon oleaginosum]TXT04109.1 hypothetical protein COLE_07806 [Cutaneotrichosporon oleaginosum]
MPILILDGGMGTTLEADGHDVSGPMWGSELVSRNPEALANVHARYVSAGADIIETATYQMTLPALVGLGHDEATARALMHRAVSLAADLTAPNSSPATLSSTLSAVASALKPTPAKEPPKHKHKVALALGPYGATLSPGQEYDGLYPPPYGPAGYSPSSQATNYAPPEDEAAYEAALTQFHLDRLRVYAAAPSWPRVAWLAFETIPLLREIRAIRRAVGALRAELGDAKPFWISSAYPNGSIGQRDARGQPADMSAVAAALVGDLPPLAPFDGAPRPDGVGVNCTHPTRLPVLLGALSGAITAHARRRKQAKAGAVPAPDGQAQKGSAPHAPWLILYPDGGASYDVVNKKWTDRIFTPLAWAERVLALAHEAEATGVWTGVVLGGCCKSSFEEVASLRALVDRPTERRWEESVRRAEEI